MFRPAPPRLRDRLDRSPRLQVLLLIVLIVAVLLLAAYTKPIF